MTVIPRPRTDTRLDVDIRKLTGPIGAEVVGIDITGDLAEQDVATIRAALLEHKALVFRDVDLDDAAQERFAARFGPLTIAHPNVRGVDGEPGVLPVDSETSIANQWHTDVTFIANPPAISTLVSHVVPPYGGETLIANTATAYRRLPAPLRALADALWAEHTNDYDYIDPGYLDSGRPDAAPGDSAQDDPADWVDAFAEYHREFVATTFRAAHPVVRVHPETGERGLFLGGFAQKLVGFGPSQSRTVIDLLQSYVTRPDNVLRVTWQPRQLVMFDNRITQHYALDNYDRLPRVLHRVTVAGDRPRGVDGRRGEAIQGDSSHYSPIPD